MDKSNKQFLGDYLQLCQLSTKELVEEIKNNPQRIEQAGCPWGKLMGGQWVELLSTHPQYSKYCDGEKLKAGNWARLLRVQPQLAMGCPWDTFTKENWDYLLKERSEFESFRRMYDSDYDLSGVMPADLANILVSKPQLASRCSIDTFKKFNVPLWKLMLSSHSKILDYLPQGTLASLEDHEVLLYLMGIGRLGEELLSSNKNAWVACLSAHKASSVNHIDKCPFKDFTHSDWTDVITYNLTLFKHPDFDSSCLEDMEWARLIARHPQLFKQCPLDKLSSDALFYLIHWVSYSSKGNSDEEVELERKYKEDISYKIYAAYYASCYGFSNTSPVVVSRKKALKVAITREDFPWGELV